MAHRPFPLLARLNQRLLPNIPESTDPPSITMSLNLTPRPRKLSAKAFYVDQNRQQQQADIWDNVEQIS
jgi:hypothetical protein